MTPHISTFDKQATQAPSHLPVHASHHCGFVKCDEENNLPAASPVYPGWSSLRPPHPAARLSAACLSPAYPRRSSLRWAPALLVRLVPFRSRRSIRGVIIVAKMRTSSGGSSTVSPAHSYRSSLRFPLSPCVQLMYASYQPRPVTIAAITKGISVSTSVEISPVRTRTSSLRRQHPLPTQGDAGFSPAYPDRASLRPLGVEVDYQDLVPVSPAHAGWSALRPFGPQPDDLFENRLPRPDGPVIIAVGVSPGGDGACPDVSHRPIPAGHHCGLHAAALEGLNMVESHRRRQTGHHCGCTINAGLRAMPRSHRLVRAGHHCGTFASAVARFFSTSHWPGRAGHHCGPQTSGRPRALAWTHRPGRAGHHCGCMWPPLPPTPPVSHWPVRPGHHCGGTGAKPYNREQVVSPAHSGWPSMRRSRASRRCRSASFHRLIHAGHHCGMAPAAIA